MNAPKVRRTDYTILFLILIVATLARVIKLDSSLWYDEIISLINFVRLPVSDILSNFSSFNNQVFYTLQAKASAQLFGESNWSIRLPAVIFGLAGIAVMWRLVYSISGTIQAHVCAILLALSYHHVWFSQNARGYTELMFWCMASTIVLKNCLNAPTWKGWLIYSFILAAAMYTHLTAGVFFLAQGIFVMATVLRRPGEEQKTSKRDYYLLPFFGFLTAIILTLLLYSPSLGQLFESILNAAESSEVAVMKEYQSPVWAALEIVRSLGRPSPLTIVITLASLILTGIGFFSILKKEPMIPIIFFLHVALMLVVLLALSMRVWPRFFFIDLGFILFFVTQGVFVCCRQIARVMNKYSRLKISGKHLFILSAVMMSAISCFLVLRNYQLPKQNLESPIHYIEKRQLHSDIVVTLGLSSVPYNEYFKMGWPAIETENQLRKVVIDATNTWIVIIFPAQTSRKFSAIMSHVEKNFSLSKTFKGTLGDGDVLIYLSKKTPWSGLP